MLSALISFFGGTGFRMLWGEIRAWITARQSHAHEIERLRLQAELDAAQHARNLEAIKVQADLKVQVIRVQGEADGRLERLRPARHGDCLPGALGPARSPRRLAAGRAGLVNPGRRARAVPG